MSITDAQAGYVAKVVEEMRAAGLRVESDLRNEKISYKIREHSLQKLPYQVVCGDKEVQANKVAVRNRKGEDLGQMSVAEFVERLKREVQMKV
jgi:threonyl-tRNA synthetase